VSSGIGQSRPQALLEQKLTPIMVLKGRFAGVVLSAAGFSVAVQALAFLRQLLIAALFGVTREIDMYVVIYAIATFTVFTFAGVFDTVAVSRLVRAREAGGAEAARALANAIFRISLWISAAAVVALLLAVQLLAPIMATGFSPDERLAMTHLAWYFAPWAVVSLPYYAFSAAHKAQWHFTRVFSAELTVIVVSSGVLALWHDGIASLPLAYAAGYLAGFLQLVPYAGLNMQPWRDSAPRSGLVRNIGELYTASQAGSLVGIIDRHIQSFVPGGGIAAVNYSGQVVNGLATVLSLRESFVVPLARERDRAERLERLLCGLVLVAIPLSGIVACFAPDIVTVLFLRGRFDATAASLTAEALRINALVLCTAAMHPPLYRMLQIVDRIHLSYAMFFTWGLSIALFGYLLVIWLQLGVRGIAATHLAGSIATCAVTAWLVARCNVTLRWSRVLGYIVFAAIASAAASLAALAAASPLEHAWGRLLLGGGAYATAILAFYFPARFRLRDIIFSRVPTERQSP
jgi:peptidoglycan biosynthesis protein MviN/MurJ (putative lipid II flippase)